jgi:nucleotide-binding universal stress UspA family protein
MAAARQCELVAVRVWQPRILASYAPMSAQRCASQEQAIAAGGLKAAVYDVVGRVPRIVVRKVLATGLTAPALLRLAEGADLLVLGGRRAAGPFSPPVGPVALACLRHAPCPIVIVETSVPAVTERPADPPPGG